MNCIKGNVYNSKVIGIKENVYNSKVIVINNVLGLIVNDKEIKDGVYRERDWIIYGERLDMERDWIYRD